MPLRKLNSGMSLFFWPKDLTEHSFHEKQCRRQFGEKFLPIAPLGHGRHGHHGAAGALATGALATAQDEKSCVACGTLKEAFRRDEWDRVLPLPDV